MNQFNQSNNWTSLSETMQGSVDQTDVREFLLKVYNWMAMGLAITGIVAYGVSESQTLTQFIFGNFFIVIGLLLFQVFLVFAIEKSINKISSTVALGLFFLYSLLTGVVFAMFFLFYTKTSIYSTFFVCSAMFISVSIFGYITKMDLSRIGGFLFMGLWGLIIANAVNIFVASSTLYWIVSNVGVLIFVGLTAFDTQKLKKIAQNVDANSEQGKKGAIMGALQLYLDFINMFIFLLRILGSRR